MMLIDNKFNIGDEVYLKTDAEQSCRIVTGMNLRLTSISYNLSCGINESAHYDFEITVDKDVLKTTTN
jgi:hypothetical protein